MTQPGLQELAKLGDPNAIATLLSAQLEPEGVAVSVDRDSGRLTIGLYADQLDDRDRLVGCIVQTLQVLNLSSIQTVNVFGYVTGEFAPVWTQPISLTRDTNSFLPLSSTDAPANHLPSGMGDRFLVCGLGSLGQYSIFNLKKFTSEELEIYITAIDLVQPTDWEVDNLPDLLAAAPIIGDCRREAVLRKAGAVECRAILLVTSDESVNIEAAIAARKINPHARLVVRSSRTHLNQLLKAQLGDFIALEATELPAPTFALAGLGGGVLGVFNIGNVQLRVVEQQVRSRDPRFDNMPTCLIHRKNYRLLRFPTARPNPDSLFPAALSSVRSFHQWQPDATVSAGDTIVYIEVVEPAQSSRTRKKSAESRQQVHSFWQDVINGQIWQKIAQAWQLFQRKQTSRIISVGLVTATLLWILGGVLLKTNIPNLTWQKAFSASVILLLGGYGDLFGGLDNEPVPAWVLFICLCITAISILFILGVLGLIADALLASRFEFFRHRPPIPKQDHVVLVGLGRVGRRIATLLQEFQQPIAALTEQLEESSLLTQLPILTGNLIANLSKANLATARSVIVVTDDQMLNLEVALSARNAARQANREIGLVIRTYDQNFSDNLMELLPDAKALCAYALSAEAFAGAAFGENMLSLFRLNEQTILVAEYTLSEGDTLVGKLLAEVAYGFGVVPIFYQKAEQALQGESAEFFLPTDDKRLSVGDRLIVLASMNGLRRIELGEITPPRRWRLELQKPLNQSFILDAGSTLARISGCELDKARTFVNQLPGAIDLMMYDHQAHHLFRELSKQLPVTLYPL
jgi:voltage-gated potassium channel Kch